MVPSHIVGMSQACRMGQSRTCKSALSTMPMFRALIGFFFSLLGFLQQFDQIMRGALRFGSFGNHVVTLQWITLRFPGRYIDVPGKAFCCDIMVENEDAGRHLYRGLIFGKKRLLPNVYNLSFSWLEDPLDNPFCHRFTPR